MKKLTSLILTLLILIFAGLIIYFYKNKANTGNFSVNVNVVKEKKGKYSINAEYPTFASAPKEFNQKIQKDIDERIKYFKKTIIENEKVRQDVTYFYELWWEPKQLNSHYISFIVRDTSFTGGANLNTDVFTYNYDLSVKKEVQLADLFKTQNYLQALSSYVKSDLISQFKSSSISEALLEEGAAAKEINFKNFVFNDSVIDFYFPKYQVAPGAAGEQHVILPRDVVIKDEAQTSGIANPASTNCVQKGAQSVIQKGPKGEYGVCVFTDNRQCEEWAMYRGECPVGGVKITGYTTDEAKYCALVGGNYTEKTDNCSFKGKNCPAKQLYAGECSLR